MPDRGRGDHGRATGGRILRIVHQLHGQLQGVFEGRRDAGNLSARAHHHNSVDGVAGVRDDRDRIGEGLRALGLGDREPFAESGHRTGPHDGAGRGVDECDGLAGEQGPGGVEVGNHHNTA